MKDNLLGDAIAWKILILLLDKKNTSPAISKKIGCTVGAMHNNLAKLEEAGVLIKVKRGRVYEIKLTDNGEKIAEHLNKIGKLLK